MKFHNILASVHLHIPTNTVTEDELSRRMKDTLLADEENVAVAGGSNELVSPVKMSVVADTPRRSSTRGPGRHSPI